MGRYLIIWFVILFGAALLPAQELSEKQRTLSGRYAQLEQIILRLSEASANSNPRQSALLKKMLLESKDKLLVRRLEALAAVLERRQLTDAVTGQTEIEKDLLELLKFLENANRDERRDGEKERIKEFLRSIEELLHQEGSLKNRTYQQESQNIQQFEKEQQDIRLRTQTLQDRLAEHEGIPLQKEEQNESENGEKPADLPSMQALQKATKRMNQAEQKLQKAEKEGAIEDQEEAIAELRRAKEELEKILRQIREEELMQTLEKLEERFKRMLRQEESIRSQTDRIKNETEADSRQTKIKADRLTLNQQSVIEEADRALLILREDGTAQAMVESLLQVRFDMTETKRRLEQTVLDAVTLQFEDAVIASLQEMLDAVQTAMEESKQRQANDQPPPQGEGNEAEEPLIQLLAELRMIRSMQRRVNERTERYDRELENLWTVPDADWQTLKRNVEELARQQNRISRILHDIKIGKTK